jgi:uncharacterized protein
MENMKTRFNFKADKRQIILMITQTCNLNCAYCYEKNKSIGNMTVATAKAILKQELERIEIDRRTKRIEFAYLGGEPLLNFPLIQELSEWLWMQKISLPYELTLRTNGTLLTDEMKRWFLKNRDRIDVGLSMDGLSEMNRFNRTGHDIDWSFFFKNWPKHRVKIVLFRDSVQFLAKTVREMNRVGIPIEVAIGEGFYWDGESARILEEQLAELIPDYLFDLQEAVDSGLFSFRVGDYFPEYRMNEVMFCGEKSKNIIAYDIDGSPCICHMFATPTIGKEKARWAWEHLQDIEELPFDLECKNCPVHKNCKSCFGINMLLYGDISRSAARETICKAIKAKARACAFFYLKQIENKIRAKWQLNADEELYAEKALRLLEVIPSFVKVK